MSRINLYADESGNFDWSHPPKGSRYFILTTIAVHDSHEIAHDLLALRRRLAWDGVDIDRAFHATEDTQAIRDEVFRVITGHDLRVDATILEKAKAEPRLRSSPERFYQYAWYYHMKHIVPVVSQSGDDLFVVAASVGTKKKREAFYEGVRNVMEQVAGDRTIRTACWPAAIDPCLQVADYCSWAIQRQLESEDDRSFVLIKPYVKTMFELFKSGSTYYY